MTSSESILPTLAAGPADPPDEALARAAARQPHAFAALYRRHAERVYRYLLARTGSVPDAQDLTTQTFMAALEGIGGYRGEGPFAAWLMGIARRIAAGHYRRSRPALPLDDAARLPHPDPLPDDAAAQSGQWRQVVEAVRTLSDDRAEALALRYFAGLSPAEIAPVMGRSESAVRMLISRALSDLRGMLVDEEEAQS